MLTRAEIYAYVKEKYQTQPDNIWNKHPHYAVLRHKQSRKWYGLVMDISRCKIGMKGEDSADILNLKTD